MVSGQRDIRLRQIVSGGQTGVDRAALDAALRLGFPHGGWCPAGRKAEDGRIDGRYQLRETESARYEQRTEQNVIDSDATLILCCGPLTGGTLLTQKFALRYLRPLMIVELQSPAAETVPSACTWLANQRVEILNVAGPRESTWPGIYRLAHGWMMQLLEQIAEMRPRE